MRCSSSITRMHKPIIGAQYINKRPRFQGRLLLNGYYACSPSPSGFASPSGLASSPPSAVLTSSSPSVVCIQKKRKEINTSTIPVLGVLVCHDKNLRGSNNVCVICGSICAQTNIRLCRCDNRRGELIRRRRKNRARQSK